MLLLLLLVAPYVTALALDVMAVLILAGVAASDRFCAHRVPGTAGPAGAP